jgi:hypothetical protein
MFVRHFIVYADFLVCFLTKTYEINYMVTGWIGASKTIKQRRMKVFNPLFSEAV